MLAACGGGRSEPPPMGTRVAPALAAALAAADHAKLPWRCAAADGSKLVDETITLGAHSWQLAGNTMRLERPGTISIGVIADAGGAAPATLAALGRLRAAFGDVDLVLALGGMGSTQQELEATLGVLAGAWPVVAVPGDLEPVPAQQAAIASLRARGKTVIDGRLARRIELPGATIAIVPGAGSQGRLVAGVEGCTYQPAEVTAALAELSSRIKLRILASAEAPRVLVHGEPAGELALTATPPHELDVALHGPVTEAGSPARAGARDGNAIALTPGTSDATTRLPGPRRAASAGLLTLTGTAWRWRAIVAAE